jgi:K+-sensing histidine kinase KdpD
METESLHTDFAPAERANDDRLSEQKRIMEKNIMLNSMGDAVSKMILVLNKQRQIVYSNKRFMDFAGWKDINELLGKRPGEAVKCMHSNINTGGCGTSRFCRECGAINAILESHKGMQSEKECQILTQDNDALDFRVTATPYEEAGDSYTIFAISDISNEKRREVLERVFFHDVLNSAGGISGLSSILPDADDKEEVTEIATLLKNSSDMLVEEIKSQRVLNAAERGKLEIALTHVSSYSILKDIHDIYLNHEVTSNKKLVIDSKASDAAFVSDPVLLRRIIANMTKNALEASMPEGTVTISTKEKDNSVVFSVHNMTYMDESIQHQLFKRSFSTKGNGRGIGTYSIKLFGEKYLKGNVWFESTEEKGTTFYIEIYKKFPGRDETHY